MEYKKKKEKCWFFTIIEKIKYLARLNKQKTRSLKLLKTEGKKGDITDTLNLQKILSE